MEDNICRLVFNSMRKSISDGFNPIEVFIRLANSESGKIATKRTKYVLKITAIVYIPLISLIVYLLSRNPNDVHIGVITLISFTILSAIPFAKYILAPLSEKKYDEIVRSVRGKSYNVHDDTDCKINETQQNYLDIDYDVHVMQEDHDVADCKINETPHNHPDTDCGHYVNAGPGTVDVPDLNIYTEECGKHIIVAGTTIESELYDT